MLWELTYVMLIIIPNNKLISQMLHRALMNLVMLHMIAAC